MKMHRFEFTKMTIVLTDQELHRLLMQNKELFRIGLERGKSFKRTESKNKQYEAKFGELERQQLNEFLQ